jgi:hypothetical protein
MRLWSVHPRYLDRQGLTACWREALLAQAVIDRTSGGYSNHPQLQRFRATDDPLAAVGAFLRGVAEEADARGYRFAKNLILRDEEVPQLPLHSGQLHYEWSFLLSKLALRSPDQHRAFASIRAPDPHPLFTVVDGGIEAWERPKESA